VDARGVLMKEKKLLPEYLGLPLILGCANESLEAGKTVGSPEAKAALELLRRSDVMPLVFECDSQVGGIAKTVVYRGNRMDLGGHRFFSAKPDINQGHPYRSAWWPGRRRQHRREGQQRQRRHGDD